MRWSLLIGLLSLLVMAACSSVPAVTQSVATAVSPTAVSPTPTIIPLPTPLPTLESRFEPPPRRRLGPGDLLLAADIDDIPAIFAEDGLFVDAQTGSEEWPDAEGVLGLVINGDARAYPVRLLSLHEIVNDTVGGRPVAVTWCPLCFSAIVYERQSPESELTFGVSGYLYNNNLVMYDHQSNTLWSQLLGQGIRGALRGTTLNMLPSQLTTWQAWKSLHPETRILSAAQLGKRADELVDPYGSYYASGFAGLTGSRRQDDRLPTKALVVGIVSGAEARAYPLELLREVKVVNDSLAEVPLILAYDAALQTAVTFHRAPQAQPLTFHAAEAGQMRDNETGSLWDVRTGTAVSGPLQGVRLERVAGPLLYWFAWSDVHAETEIYAP